MFIRSIQPPTSVASEAVWFLFQENNLLLTDQSVLPTTFSIEVVQALTSNEIHFLGAWNERPVYTVDVPAGVEAPAGHLFTSFRQFYKHFDDETFMVASTASQICRWDRDHQFCGKCGSVTITAPGERGKQCTVCGHVAFPHLSPAVIMAVVKDNKVLLAQNYKWVDTKLFSSLAGFVEPGETAEEAVEREVLEEVGITVKNVRYVTSQSWPFPGSLMLGYVAEYESGEITPDGIEIITAGWFGIDELPGVIPNKKTISRWILEAALGPIDRE